MLQAGTMTYSFEFDVSPEDVFVRLSGESNVADMEAYLAALVGDPRWRPGMSVLIDTTGLDTSRLTNGDISRIATLFSNYREQLGGGKRAQVAARPSGFGVTRMIASLADARGVDFASRVFRSHEEARLWLAIENGRD